jgi:hypothetical protein
MPAPDWNRPLIFSAPIPAVDPKPTVGASIKPPFNDAAIQRRPLGTVRCDRLLVGHPWSLHLFDIRQRPAFVQTHVSISLVRAGAFYEDIASAFLDLDYEREKLRTQLAAVVPCWFIPEKARSDAKQGSGATKLCNAA